MTSTTALCAYDRGYDTYTHVVVSSSEERLLGPDGSTVALIELGATYWTGQLFQVSTPLIFRYLWLTGDEARDWLLSVHPGQTETNSCLPACRDFGDPATQAEWEKKQKKVFHWSGVWIFLGTISYMLANFLLIFLLTAQVGLFPRAFIWVAIPAIWLDFVITMSPLL
jgi:hypothetical protein